MIKIIEIIKNFLKKDKVKQIEDKTSYNNQRDVFVNTITTNNDTELIDLQKRLEHNQISVNDLNIFNVMDLIEKYEKQLVELDLRIQKN